MKEHNWKICPIGSYYVKEHYKTINGKKYFWQAHCRKGKFKKDVLNADEINAISKRFATEKLKPPKAYNFNAKDGNKYDLLIAGWVKYWRDVFGTESKITVDFVKILMMSESSFRPNITAQTHNNSGHAIGLMQLTDTTLKLIQEESKELRDHAFRLKRDDLFDQNVNICVGVRWLFRKREIAKYLLKKEPTELQLAEEYKGIRNDSSEAASEQREAFKQKFKEYRDAKNL